MKSILILSALLCGSIFAKAQPNILLLYADDLGYGELGCYGFKEVPTPHIDSIATNGIRFTQGYVSAPLCSPSRAGLMTGRYQQRFGHENNTMTAEKGLPIAETTLANRMNARANAGRPHFRSQGNFATRCRAVGRGQAAMSPL